jgi:hypothetical protein
MEIPVFLFKAPPCQGGALTQVADEERTAHDHISATTKTKMHMPLIGF